MNTDLNELISFAADEVSKIHAAFNRSGMCDDGSLSINDEDFEAMMNERLEFLCADSPISLELRKSALSYQTQQLCSIMRRVPSVGSENMNTLLNMLDDIAGPKFIPTCQKRAELLNRILQQTLQAEIQNQTKRKTTP